jgi:hypothetical protein
MKNRRGRAAALVALATAAALLTLALATLLLAAGCDMPSTGGLGQVIGSGEPVTKDYDFTGFTKVAVDGGFTVDIDYAETSEVSVTVDDNLVMEHLKVELDGDTLRIGLADLGQYRNVTVRATVIMPRITGLEVSGASDVHLGPLSADAVTLDVSGASRVEGSASLGEVAGEVSGASAVGLAGSADGLQLEASGGSRLELFQLTAQTADLSVSGGSRARVTVTGRLDAEASGGSRIEYAGDPQLGTIDASGGSAVEPAGS